jgi:hypothetical protein
MPPRLPLLCAEVGSGSGSDGAACCVCIPITIPSLSLSRPAPSVMYAGCFPFPSPSLLILLAGLGLLGSRIRGAESGIRIKSSNSNTLICMDARRGSLCIFGTAGEVSTCAGPRPVRGGIMEVCGVLKANVRAVEVAAGGRFSFATVGVRAVRDEDSTRLACTRGAVARLERSDRTPG